MDKLINDIVKCSIEENNISDIVNDTINDTINDATIWLIDIINNQKEKEKQANIWNDSPYKIINNLKSNNVGNVGEKLIQKICVESNINSSIDGSKTKKIGGSKIGDGKINNKSVEVKTAQLSADKKTFQHEIGRSPWKAEYMMFIDISPTDIYITIFKNFTEEHYNTGAKAKPYFPTKHLYQREEGKGNYKLDTTININIESIKNGFAIKIKSNNFKEIREFINRSII